MRVLVQDLVTSAYFQGPGCWTADAERALAFADSHAAAQFCLENEITQAQVVLKFPDDQYDVQLPLHEAVMPQPHESAA
jgi:hypothetical protein